MIEHQERLTLREFLESVHSRTGDPLESSALAEMSGYSVDDAREEGWPDLFAAAQGVPPHIDLERGDQEGQPRISPIRAFVRGLTYTAPVLAMWALFPRPITTAEIWFLAVLVIISWGGSMASNHVVGVRLWGDAARAWTFALRVAVVAVAVSCVSSLALAGAGIVGVTAAVLGVIQVLYFFCASPLMLRRSNALLGVVALLGAAAGVGSLLAGLPAAGTLYDPGLVGPLRLVAAACLVLPSILLLVQVRVARAQGGPAYRVDAMFRDTLSFGAYGTMFGCLVLWGPLVAPDSSATLLSFVIVGGIAFAEVAVARVRQRADRLLAEPFAPAAFVARARLIVMAGVLWYVVPITVATLLAAAWMVLGAGTDVGLALAIPAVICLGAAQVISLIGMALNGIRQVAVVITACTLGLLTMTPAADVAIDQISLYLATMVVLDLALLAVALRLAHHPINHL